MGFRAGGVRWPQQAYRSLERTVLLQILQNGVHAISHKHEPEDPMELVGELRREGKSAGAGHFTLASEKARQGLDRRPGLYLLKLVQFAVASGCRRLEIRLGRGCVEIRGIGGGCTRQELELALLGPFSFCGRRAVQHLAWAFLLAHPFQNFQMALEGGLYDGTDWRDSEISFGFHLRLTRANDWADFARRFVQTSNEHSLLYDRCSYAPIPVFLDGRLVNCPERLERQVPKGDLAGPLVMTLTKVRRSEILVERNWLSRSGVLGPLPSTRSVRRLRIGEQYFKLPLKSLEYNQRGGHIQAVHLCEWLGTEEMQVHESDHPEPDFYPLARSEASLGVKQVLSVSNLAFRPYQSDIDSRPRSLPSLTLQRILTSFEDWDRNYPRVSLRLMLPLSLSGPSQLVCVLDGVALEPHQLEMPNPGWLVLACADDLQTDLSQFRLVDDAKLDKLKTHLRNQAIDMLRDFWTVEDGHYPPWVLQHLRERGCCVSQQPQSHE